MQAPYLSLAGRAGAAIQAALSFTCGWRGSSNTSRPIFHWRVEGEQQSKPPYLSLAGRGGAAKQAALSFTGVWSGSSNASRPVFRSRAREPGGVRV